MAFIAPVLNDRRNVDYIAGRISRAAFWELVKFKHPTHQIAFFNDKALQTLTYKNSYEL